MSRKKDKGDKSRYDKLMAKVRKLLPRAAMSIYAFNTGVLIGQDDKGRVAVKSGTNPYGDCVAIQYNPEGADYWYEAHLSPARARLFALQILSRCEKLEATDPGMNCIDKPSEQDAKLIEAGRAYG